MEISINSPSDRSICSPNTLIRQLTNQSKIFGKIQFNEQTLTASISPKINDLQEVHKEFQIQNNNRMKKVKIGIKNGLKELIKRQKINKITKKFVQNLKINNTNSQYIEFTPFSTTQRQYFFDHNGLQLADWTDKLTNILIIIAILLCIFIDTTLMAFPQIKQTNTILFIQLFSLLVFIFQIFSSIFIVKIVQGKKISIIKSLFMNYLMDGLIIDIIYLIILIVDIVSDAGITRVFIVLKLPEFFSRIEKIQNSTINTFYKQQYWGIAKVLLINFSLSHILSILLILMSHLNPQQNWIIKYDLQHIPWYQQYIWGFYWGTTIMLTVGFGDIAPVNYKQAMCLVLIQTFSCLALAYNINCVGNLISNIKSQDIQKNKNIKTFKSISNRNSLSQQLQMKIHNYIEQSTKIKKKFNFQQESSFLSTLPKQLKADFLKQSNKKIFQELIFFKDLTYKSLITLSQAIQMKICHPQQVIKKRGQLSDVLILGSGRIRLTTNLVGSLFHGITIDTVQVKQGKQPFLLSLDFLSNDTLIYDLKSDRYSILYCLDKQKILDSLRITNIDHQHFCVLKDKMRYFKNQFEVFHCQYCLNNHTKFQCPKFHYVPLNKSIIDKYLYDFKNDKNQRFLIKRKKKFFNCLLQYQENRKCVEIHSMNIIYKNQKIDNIKEEFNKIQKIQSQIELIKSFNSQNYNFNSIKYKSWNTGNFPSQNILILNNQNNSIVDKNINNTLKSFNLPTQKKLQFQYLTNQLKQELQKMNQKFSSVWTIQTDQIKNFTFYFPLYNASNFQYFTAKKQLSKKFKK